MIAGEPELVSVSIPEQVQSDNTFSITARVRQHYDRSEGGPGYCGTGITDLLIGEGGTTTPVIVRVNGEERGRREFCLSEGSDRTATFGLTLTQGIHNVEIVAQGVEKDSILSEETFFDATEITRQIEARPDNPDPTEPTFWSEIELALNDIASRIGTTANGIIIGAIAIILLLVLL